MTNKPLKLIYFGMEFAPTVEKFAFIVVIPFNYHNVYTAREHRLI